MKKRPNILLIVADQLRYDCIGYSKEYPVLTPSIDKLASEGMWFKSAFTSTPLCCPARQSLLNGRRAESFGAHWNYDITMKIPALNPSEYTWTKELKENGYMTAYIGKWHVNGEHTPLEYGFDYYVGEEHYEEYREEHYPDVQYINGWLGEVDQVPLEETRTHWLSKLAINKINEFSSGDEPWHIRLDFPEPHLPCRPVQQFADLYKPEEIPEWKNFRDSFVNKPYIQKQQLLNWSLEEYNWKDWSQIVARYYAIITQMDDAVGKVLNEIKNKGLEKDTVIIFTADHGDMCGAHRMMDKHYIMYDDVVKVPLIIKWADTVEKNSCCEEFVINCLDIAPTVVELSGLRPKEFFHGKSLNSVIRGEKPEDWRNSVVSTYNGQQFGLYNQRMIRNNEWKYIWNATDLDELYNLKSDPGELINLIGEKEYEPLIAELKKQLYNELEKDKDLLVTNSWVKSQLLSNKKLNHR